MEAVVREDDQQTPSLTVGAEPTPVRDVAVAEGRRRNTSLDGVRGIAVFFVILYHHSFFNAGWMGVDLFFVLSGYLITSIIWRTSRDQLFWREFWLKRVTRILPPMVLLLCLAAIFAPALSLWQAVAYLLSGGDVLAYLRPTYEPLRPLWSLAVEEHFYILWPFAVRFLRRRYLLYLLAATILLEVVARGVGIVAVRDWQFIYFLTPFRLDGLAFGCLLALLLMNSRAKHMLTAWSGLGIGVAVAAWFGFRVYFGLAFTRGQTVVYNSVCYSLVSLFAFFCIAYLLTHPRSIAARILSWKPLAYFGTISYGIYLYQVVVLVALMTKYRMDMREALAIGFPILLLLSYLSYEFYEKPIIKWGKRTAESWHTRGNAEAA